MDKTLLLQKRSQIKDRLNRTELILKADIRHLVQSFYKESWNDPEINEDLKGIAQTFRRGFPVLCGFTAICDTAVSGPLLLHNVRLDQGILFGCGGIVFNELTTIAEGSIVVVRRGVILRTIDEVVKATVGNLYESIRPDMN